MKQNKKLYVAISGGIGSGKSTVLAEIAKMGFPTCSADSFAKDMYDRQEILVEIERHFPECVNGGVVDRKKLARIVFSNREKLAALNRITHPFIMQETLRFMKNAKGKVVFAEVPLLFEGGYEKLFDRVIVVQRPCEARLHSVVQRDSVTEKEVLERMKNQIDYEKFPISAHTVLYNDGDLSALKNQVAQIVHEIVSKQIE